MSANRPNRGWALGLPRAAAMFVGLGLAGPPPFPGAEGATPAPAPQDGPFRFRDVAAEQGLHEPLRGMMGHAAAWGDADGDGRPDLFVGTYTDRPLEDYREGGADGPVPNRLLLNRGGRFELSADPALAWEGRASGCIFADFDNDGRADLYVTNNGRKGNRNLLYRNLGDGRWAEVGEAAGAPVHLPETARGVAVLDFDGDGLLDLFVAATRGRGESLLFRNLGGMRFARSDALPADATGLGVAAGDLTGNGWTDLWVGGPNRLFVNLGGGRFREADELGLDWGFAREDDSPSCGVAFGDVDRDGDADVLIGGHFKKPWADPQPLRLFLNRGSTPERVRFEEVTAEAGIVPFPMKTPHVEIRDFDNDGWPDLYTAAVTLRGGRVFPAIYHNRGAENGVAGPAASKTPPRFEETAFVHRSDFPSAEDYAPGMRTGEFYARFAVNEKVMYYAPGPSSDFDRDGRLDLFLGSWFPVRPSLLLRNESEAGNYLTVAVEGAPGSGVNRMGIGSVVRAYRRGHAGDPAHLLASEEIATGYGFCSGQHAAAHLGLGAEDACDLVVNLPGGRGQVVRPGVAANAALVVAAPTAGGGGR